MLLKIAKLGMLSTAGLVVAGGAIFGRDLISYANSSARFMQCSVKSAVPVEFELKRARDLVDDIVPEMQANVRMIAEQEVEIGNLRDDIDRSGKSLSDERTRLAKVRDSLSSEQTSFTFGQCTYSRDELKDDLARRFESVKEAQVVQSGKQRLLENRQKSLAAAMQQLERTRSQKSLLESQIASLEAQNQLVKAAAAGSGTTIDTGKLAQSERLISDIKKELDVSERVLAHESQFVQPIAVDAINEKDLVRQVDDYLTPKSIPSAPALAQAPDTAGRSLADQSR